MIFSKRTTQAAKTISVMVTPDVVIARQRTAYQPAA